MAMIGHNVYLVCHIKLITAYWCSVDTFKNKAYFGGLFLYVDNIDSKSNTEKNRQLVHLQSLVNFSPRGK